MTQVLIGGTLLVLVGVLVTLRRRRPAASETGAAKMRLSFPVRLQRFLRTDAITWIVWALVINTALAQLYYNSAGEILPGPGFAPFYLIASAILSTTAFSLFEVRQVKTIHDLTSGERTAGTWEMIKNIATLIVIAAYNFYSIALLNAAIWPSLHFSQIPEPPSPWRFYLHAFMYSAILFLAGVVGERKISVGEKVAQVQEEFQIGLLEDARDEGAALRHGDRSGGHMRAITAMAVLGSAEHRAFFRDYHAIMMGTLTMDDVQRAAENGSEHGAFERRFPHWKPQGSQAQKVAILPTPEASVEPSVPTLGTQDHPDSEASELQLGSQAWEPSSETDFQEALPIMRMAQLIGCPNSSLARAVNDSSLAIRLGSQGAKLVTFDQVRWLIEQGYLSAAAPWAIAFMERVA